MKIAVSASSPALESPVDPRFGRCPYYLIVDPGTMEFEAVDNPHVGASGGAGIQAAQLVAQKGVEAVLTGSCGPNAFQTLKAAGVRVVVGVTGTISEAVRNYRAGGVYREADAADVPTHHGLAGRQAPFSPPERPVPGQATGPSAPQEELLELKRLAADLRRQTEQVFERIAALERKAK